MTRPLSEPKPELQFLTVETIATVLDVGKETVRRWVRDGDLPAFRKGEVIRISEQAFLEFLLENSTL